MKAGVNYEKSSTTRNKTQTAVINMAIKRMLETKVHLFSNMRFIAMFITAVCVFLQSYDGQKKERIFHYIFKPGQMSNVAVHFIWVPRTPVRRFCQLGAC